MEKVTDKIHALPEGANYYSLEFFPPKTSMGFANLTSRLERMSQALRPLFVTVTWGAGGSTATKSLELAEICQRQLGLTTCLHLTCTNMSRSLIDEALEQAKVLGIRNILALRGDAPRSEEYRDEAQSLDEDSNKDFTWAIDLVRYIKRQYGEYFCVGVAAYPEGHSDESHPEHQDPGFDMPYLVEKTKAGADFLMTQLFFDVQAFDRFEEMLRGHESGVFKTIPIIPGLMPIQSYQILRRTTKLSHAKLPAGLLERLDAVKGDDELVKQVGVQILSEMVEHIKKRPSVARRGFHFYTLNLEKAVSHILENTHLIPPTTIEEDAVIDVELTPGTLSPPSGDSKRRRLSSVNSGPRNRVVVSRPSKSSNVSYEAPEDEAGIPKGPINTRANTLAISEGEGSLGREATWDDFPNGRWGDARSPAFGEIDGYGPTLHVSTPQALKLWGYPVEVSDISTLFRKHISGELSAIPWSEQDLSPETSTISKQLLALNSKGWWSVASQPAVNGVKSTDAVFGWGPRNGFVFQKPFVEFFIPSADFDILKPRLIAHAQITFFAANSRGAFECSEGAEEGVNPVTWGTFAGKEIITPTIIEAVSFRSWSEEAFSIWREWQRVYPGGGGSAKLLAGVREDVWLVNVIWGDFVEGGGLWEFLMIGQNYGLGNNETASDIKSSSSLRTLDQLELQFNKQNIMLGTTIDGMTNGTLKSATNGKTQTSTIPPRLFSVSKTPSLGDFKTLVTESKPVHYPLAASVKSNVPIYDLPEYSTLTNERKSALQDEWYHILLHGPGVFVTKNMYRDTSLLERVNSAYAAIIQEEKQGPGKKGDHFASSGENDRIWNSFSKHCLQDPESFAEYYSNPYLPLISSAWLGPHHRLTAQVNVVKPGSKAQISHRDYHLGFQSTADCERFPQALQVASQFLTLQGAVAHSDMPVESGPTRLLPFSQKFEEGYMAYRIPEIQNYFLEKFVRLPLAMGDGLFFNPALFHAAGQNDSKDIQRCANLLQISSAFGKPMENIDTLPLVERCWDGLREKFDAEGLTDSVEALVGNLAEGYPFPTNLDRRVPETAGMAPESEVGLLVRALKHGLSKEEVIQGLRNMKEDEKP
ncbi:MTHFR-domain-containing protein [Amniculicola lignicola CBS 123094]|uniref:MTHFR-domain-containing protein n=1 Tax=Amniculicola lignicola CBS 123094 TaxID=1392246 RepID=A0A6A5VVZ0_9PLEO|nr:MTHFR-domain-containing protein [Amniculicola lignicola CBS 123094]